MRIYLAGRYGRREELRSYASELTSMGHTVTSRWLNGDHTIKDKALTDGTLAFKEAQRFACEDWNDVADSDSVISFTEPPHGTNSRGGRHVELGAALALKKGIIVVGFRENVFHYLPEVVFCATWAEAKAATI